MIGKWYIWNKLRCIWIEEINVELCDLDTFIEIVSKYIYTFPFFYNKFSTGPKIFCSVTKIKNVTTFSILVASR